MRSVFTIMIEPFQMFVVLDVTFALVNWGSEKCKFYFAHRGECDDFNVAHHAFFFIISCVKLNQ
jgi:hypothetical protein